MRYRECRPATLLRPFIECLWFLTDDASQAGPHAVERIVPDGCLELIVHLGEPFRRWSMDGRPQRQPTSFVVGEMTRPLLVQPGGRVETMGIRFRPGCAHPFLGIPVDEVTDQALPLAAFWGRDGQRLEQQLLGAPDDDARVAVVQRFLSERLLDGPGVDRSVAGAVAQILACRGGIEIATLGRPFGLSQRQLQRRFRTAVGIGPKTLARIIRFQSVFPWLGTEDTPEWASIALACGYSDQSHLVREFKDLSGETPAIFHARQRGLSDHFTSPERLAALFEGSGGERS